MTSKVKVELCDKLRPSRTETRRVTLRLESRQKERMLIVVVVVVWTGDCVVEMIQGDDQLQSSFLDDDDGDVASGREKEKPKFSYN